MSGSAFAGVVAAATAVTVVAIAAQRLYLSRVCSIRAVEIARLGRGVGAVAVSALLLPSLPLGIESAGVALGAATAFLLVVVNRGFYRYWLQVGRREGRFLRPVIMVGTNEEASDPDLAKLIDDHPELGYRVVGVVGDGPGPDEPTIPAPLMGDFDRALDAVTATGANGVIVAVSALTPAQLNTLVRQLLRRNVHVHLSNGLRGIDHRRLRSQPLAHEPFFYLEPMKLARWQLATKRVMDVVGALIAAVLALPVLAVAAVAIKIQDRGPVLFDQSRVGRHGRPFTIHKLRTMSPGAEKRYDALAAVQPGREGPLIKVANDPRRTTVGRVLERTSIDELPQLWNVLRGTMSLVGPRPAQAVEVSNFDDELLTRLEVLPGITGLWQVEARDNPSYSAYRRYDLFYIENWTVSLDVAILIATVQRVLLRGLDLLVERRRAEMGTAPDLAETHG